MVRGERAMNEFNEKAFYLLVWRAVLATLVGAVFIVTRIAELEAALLVGANIALLFSIGLIAWTSQLDEEQIVRTEAWRTLTPEERPAGKSGRFCALNCLEEIAFRFAKASAAIAAALAGAVFTISADQ
jgi:hypothetical protein